MQAYIKLNNSILDCGLTVNELKVAVCLYAAAFINGIVTDKTGNHCKMTGKIQKIRLR